MPVVCIVSIDAKQVNTEYSFKDLLRERGGGETTSYPICLNSASGMRHIKRHEKNCNFKFAHYFPKLVSKWLYYLYYFCFNLLSVSTRIWNSPFAGQIRLSRGEYTNEGLVEVYCNGRWGTVCDDRFGFTEANTVCRQLGYSTAARYDHLSSLWACWFLLKSYMYICMTTVCLWSSAHQDIMCVCLLCAFLCNS